jgi:hypothetical protein
VHEGDGDVVEGMDVNVIAAGGLGSRLLLQVAQEVVLVDASPVCQRADESVVEVLAVPGLIAVSECAYPFGVQLIERADRGGSLRGRVVGGCHGRLVGRGSAGGRHSISVTAGCEYCWPNPDLLGRVSGFGEFVGADPV